jgi:fatty-acyl-CoA synthase
MDAESLLDLFEQENVNMAGGVPTIWMGITQALDAEPDRWKLPKMKMLVGGSAVPESMIRRFDQNGLEIVQGWGMTETSPLVSLSNLKPKFDDDSEDDRYARRATAGLPSPFVDVRIQDDDGTVLPWNNEDMGEIQVKGAWITGEYYNLPKSEDKFTDDGWLRTGDIARIDPEGYIHITDRTKDVIKSGGEWISSVQLENEIMAHEAVAEAAVIAQPDDKWGERPLAAVVRKSGQDVSADDLKTFLKDRLEKWMVPDDYVFIEEVPRTSTGKFNKLGLRQQLLK